MGDENPHALQPGIRVRQYEVRRVLGTGGFAHTYLTWDHNLSRQVALKELFPPDIVVRNRDGITVSPRGPQQIEKFTWAREMFIQEGRTLAQLRHKSIVQVFDIFEANSTAYLAMDFVDGMTFEHWLKKYGRPAEQNLTEITKSLLEALSLVHKGGYMHRDLKPDNILMNLDHHPVLIDFGNARVSSGEKTTVMESILTPGYAPLEQYQKKSRQGPATDLYALGAVLYRALTGSAPEDSIQRIEKDVIVRLGRQPIPGYSRKFLGTIDRALQMRQADRWQTCEEWMNALAERPHRPDAATWKVITLMLAFLSLLGGFGWFYFHDRKSPGEVVYAKPQPDLQKSSSLAPVATRPPSPPTPSKPPPATPVPLTPVPEPPIPQTFTNDVRLASRTLPFRNSLGMDFVPVTIRGGPTDGHKLLVCIHETRKSDYRQYAERSGERGGNWLKVTATYDCIKEGKKYSLSVSEGEEHPVVNVTIDGCRNFCRWLRELEKRPYRLPSDHEWSCAVGLDEDSKLSWNQNAAKNENKYPWGETFSPSQTAVGNYADETMKNALHTTDSDIIPGYQDGYATTAPVKKFPPNLYGLYDMGGNVWEYCDTEEGTNPETWIVRGGSWRTHESTEQNKYKKLTSSSRASREPKSLLDDVGFRCVIDLSENAP